MRQPLNYVTARWKRSHIRGLQHCRRPPSPELFHMLAEGRLLVLCARTTTNSFVRVEIEDLVGATRIGPRRRTLFTRHLRTTFSLTSTTVPKTFDRNDFPASKPSAESVSHPSKRPVGSSVPQRRYHPVSLGVEKAGSCKYRWPLHNDDDC